MRHQALPTTVIHYLTLRCQNPRSFSSARFCSKSHHLQHDCSFCSISCPNVEHSAHEAWSTLKPKVQVIKPKARSREDFIEECRSGTLDGIVALYRASVTVAGKFDEELVSALPQSLKFVCYTGAGYDSIHVPACTDAGIQVSNVRAAVDDATADTAVFLILGCLRMFGPHISAVRSGGWMADCPMGRDPRGLTLGVLGMGGIGKAVGRRVEQMGMKLQYHNRSKIEEEDFAYEYVSYDQLLATSDVLLLSLPLNVSIPLSYFPISTVAMLMLRRTKHTTASPTKPSRR